MTATLTVAPHSGNAWYLLVQERLNAALGARTECSAAGITLHAWIHEQRYGADPQPSDSHDWSGSPSVAVRAWESIARDLCTLTGCEITSNTVRAWASVAPMVAAPVPTPEADS